MLKLKTVDGMWPRAKPQTALVNTKASNYSKSSHLFSQLL